MKDLKPIFGIVIALSFALPSHALVRCSAACVRAKNAVKAAAYVPPPVMVQPPVAQPTPVFIDTSLCVPQDVYVMAGVPSSGCE
jgi:hypothetical protein